MRPGDDRPEARKLEGLRCPTAARGSRLISIVRHARAAIYRMPTMTVLAEQCVIALPQRDYGSQAFEEAMPPKPSHVH